MKLNNTTELKNIQDNYFVRMMLPDSEERAEPYVQEEKKALIDLMSSTDNLNIMNFIVVGAGTMWYLDLSFDRAGKYIAIEPLADIFIQKQVSFILSKHPNIKIIGSEFGDFQETDLGINNSIFVFHFNIISYIHNPLSKINKYLKEGDVLYISSWANTDEAKTARKNYFDYLNLNTDSNHFQIDPNEETGLSNLDAFSFRKLKYYKNHKRIKGKITDILIIYT